MTTYSWSRRHLSLAALPLLFVFVAGRALHAQALPTVVASGPDVGFHLPFENGSFSYAISASQTFDFGYNGTANGGTATSTNLSGDLAYVSRSENHPFSMIYSGGVLGSETSGVPTTTFQNLTLSQVLKARRDTVIIADSVNYLPESPTVGLSGIPGLGDLGVTPVQVGGYTGPGILTQYQSRVSNVVSVSDSHAFTGSTSLQASADYALQRFLGTYNNQGAGLLYGLDSDQYGAGVGVLHRVNARNSVGVNYNFQKFNYVGQSYSFQSNGVSLEYIHHFTPQLIFDGSAGPQWSSGGTLSSTYVNSAVLASLTYLAERGSYSIGYTRGTNNGSGVVAGALQNTVGFTGTRRFSRTLGGAAAVSYGRSTSLPSVITLPFTFDTEVASAQLTKGLGRYISLYASYTIENQSTPNTSNVTPLVFNGRSQILGFGITYSPGSLRFGY